MELPIPHVIGRWGSHDVEMQVSTVRGGMHIAHILWIPWHQPENGGSAVFFLWNSRILKSLHGFQKFHILIVSQKRKPLVVLTKKSPNTLHQLLFFWKRRLWWYKDFCSFTNPSERRSSTTVTITQVWFLGFIALGCLSPAANQWIRCDKGGTWQGGMAGIKELPPAP